MMRSHTPNIVVSRVIFLALACCGLLLRQTCMGQEQLLSPPQTQLGSGWLQGPAKAKLGEIAEFNIPQGYKFLDGNGASLLLSKMGNPMLKNVVGILTPNSEKGFTVIQFADVGYVSDSDKDRLDPAAILSAYRGALDRQNEETIKRGVPSITLEDWEIKPAYDPAENKLEWALKSKTDKQLVVNYCVRLLGRHGVLEAVAVVPYQANLDLSPIREALKGLAFLKGERYADYLKGDKRANLGLVALASNSNQSDKKTNSTKVGEDGKLSVLASSEDNSTQKSGVLFWAGIGAGGLIILGLGAFLVIKKPWRRGRRRSTSARRPNGMPAMAVQTVASGQNGQGASTTASVPMQDSSSSHRNGKHGERKRKKHFSFYAFHSDMVMNLTRWNYVGGFGSFSTEYPGEANGSMIPLRTRDIHSGPDSTKGLATEISKLIEGQQKLIEGQRRLIEEQNKLIQEKNKLIDAESKVLEKQSELLEEQQLL